LRRKAESNDSTSAQRSITDLPRFSAFLSQLSARRMSDPDIVAPSSKL
jgi:hypothetical protein